MSTKKRVSTKKRSLSVKRLGRSGRTEITALSKFLFIISMIVESARRTRTYDESTTNN